MAEDDKELSKDSAEDESTRDSKSWDVSNQLKALSIIATFVVSLLSIVVSLWAHNKSTDNAQFIETTRVETGGNITNSNSGDFTNPWTPWEQPITPTTTYVGLQRQIYFKHPFQVTPSVSTSFSLVDTQTLRNILNNLNYPARDQPESAWDDFHVVSMTDGISPSGFNLKVGIGVRHNPGEFLVDKLQTLAIDPKVVREMLRNNQLKDRSDLHVTRDERWLINFYLFVGSFEASWIAQDREK